MVLGYFNMMRFEVHTGAPKIIENVKIIPGGKHCSFTNMFITGSVVVFYAGIPYFFLKTMITNKY